MEFTDLRVWKEAKVLVLRVYAVTAKFPKTETYSLTDQLRRSTNSICANIAEGFNRFHGKDKIRFYYNARGSVSESQSHLIIALELGYIDNVLTEEILAGLDKVRILLNALIKSVNRCHDLRSN